MRVSIPNLIENALMGKKLVAAYTTNYKGETFKVATFENEVITKVITTPDYLDVYCGDVSHKCGFEETLEIT